MGGTSPRFSRGQRPLSFLGVGLPLGFPGGRPLSFLGVGLPLGFPGGDLPPYAATDDLRVYSILDCT